MRRYLFALVATFALVLAAVLLLNVFVDERGIYRVGATEESRLITSYVSALRASRSGLAQIPQERSTKIELVGQTIADCYVFGSSHVMEIDAETAPQLFPQCQEVVNIAVSGASFEDFVAMAGVLLERRFRGLIVFGFGPWSLRTKADDRWTENASLYYRGRERLSLSETLVPQIAVDVHLSGLLNGDYAVHNLRHVLRVLRRPPQQAVTQTPLMAVPAEAANERQNILLPNGRLVYAPDYLKQAPTAAIGDGGYKVGPVDSVVAQDIERTILALLAGGARVALLLTPYHPSIMACARADVCEMMALTETTLRSMGDRIGLPLFGSYDPRPLGLDRTDFLDQMHLSRHALRRLVNVRSNPWTM